MLTSVAFVEKLVVILQEQTCIVCV